MYIIHTLVLRRTGEISRYVIAPAGMDCEAQEAEAVAGSEGLARRLGAPVAILSRSPPAPPVDELGLPVKRPSLTGDELASAFFAER